MSEGNLFSGLLRSVRASLGGRVDDDVPPEPTTIELARRDRPLLDEEEGKREEEGDKKDDVPAASEELAASRTSSGKSAKSTSTLGTLDSVDENPGGNNCLRYILGAVGLITLAMFFFCFYKPGKQDAGGNANLEALEGHWIVQAGETCPGTPILVTNGEFNWKGQTWKFEFTDDSFSVKAGDQVWAAKGMIWNEDGKPGKQTWINGEDTMEMDKEVDCLLKGDRFEYLKGDWYRQSEADESNKMTQKINDDGSIENLYRNNLACQGHLDESLYCSNGVDATALLTEAPDGPMFQPFYFIYDDHLLRYFHRTCPEETVLKVQGNGGRVKRMVAEDKGELCNNLYMKEYGTTERTGEKQYRQFLLHMRFDVDDYDNKDVWLVQKNDGHLQGRCLDGPLTTIPVKIGEPVLECYEEDTDGNKVLVNAFMWEHQMRLGEAYIWESYNNKLRVQDADEAKWRVMQVVDEKRGRILRIEAAQSVPEQGISPDFLQGIWITDEESAPIVKIDHSGTVHVANQKTVEKIQVDKNKVSWKDMSGKMIHKDRIEWEEKNKQKIVWERKSKREDAPWVCEVYSLQEAQCKGDNAPTIKNETVLVVSTTDNNIMATGPLDPQARVGDKSSVGVPTLDQTTDAQHEDILTFGMTKLEAPSDQKMDDYTGIVEKGNKCKAVALPHSFTDLVQGGPPGWNGRWSRSEEIGLQVYVPIRGSYRPPSGLKLTKTCSKFQSACEYMVPFNALAWREGDPKKKWNWKSGKMRILFKSKDANEKHEQDCGAATIVREVKRDKKDEDWQYQTKGIPWPSQTDIWTVE